MRVYVSEMPKSQEECFFCQNGTCGICKNPCVVEECCCLEQLVIKVENVEEQND